MQSLYKVKDIKIEPLTGLQITVVNELNEVEPVNIFNLEQESNCKVTQKYLIDSEGNYRMIGTSYEANIYLPYSPSTKILKNMIAKLLVKQAKNAKIYFGDSAVAMTGGAELPDFVELANATKGESRFTEIPSPNIDITEETVELRTRYLFKISKTTNEVKN